MKLLVEVNNVPEYVKERKGYIIARICDGALWFYGFWENSQGAHEAFNKIDDAILIVKAEA